MKSIVMVAMHVNCSNQISTTLATESYVTKSALQISSVDKYNVPHLSMGLLK